MHTDTTPARTTIVIPAWGRYAGDHLQAALASIAAQARAAAVIVIDNASAPQIQAPDWVAVLRCETRVTLGSARNRGLRAARTPYVMFWDADDTMLPGTLAFLEAQLDRDTRLVAFAAAIIEARSGVRHRWPRRWVRLLTRAPPLFALVNCIWAIFPTTGATLMRVAAARAAGGFPDIDSGDENCLGAGLVWQGRCGWSERPGRLYAQHARSNMDVYYGGLRNQLRHAAAVRARLREPRVAPPWVQHLTPLIALGQWLAIGLHLALRAARRDER